MARILVVFYSHSGHTEELAKAIHFAASQVEGAEAFLKRIPSLEPEASPDRTVCDMRIPTADAHELREYDAIIFGTPSRFGTMCADMMFFLEETLELWKMGDLAGKIGSVFVTSSSQHGGQETTATTFLNALMHHGMLVVGLPYATMGLKNMAEISGGSPFGAGVITGDDGLRPASDIELDIAEEQGRRVADLAVRLFGPTGDHP